MPTFTATDGTKFQDRAEWRKYEFRTRYTFSQKTGETLGRVPGEIDGQQFNLEDLTDCTVTLLDHSDQVCADNLVRCKVFVAASAESVFVRNCVDCEFTLACKQLRTRDCRDCIIHLYAKTEPIIETSSGMVFRCFNGGYAGHEDHMRQARLPVDANLWFAVFDFNDAGRTGANWRVEDAGAAALVPWNPTGDGAPVTVPYSSAGAIPVPSKQGAPGAGTVGSDGAGVQSFGNDALTATGAVAPSLPPAATSGVGWNPNRAKASAAADAPPAPGPTGGTSGGVGWNPQRGAAMAKARVASAAPEPEKVPAASGGIGWNPARAQAGVEKREAVAAATAKAIEASSAGAASGPNATPNLAAWGHYLACGAPKL